MYTMKYLNILERRLDHENLNHFKTQILAQRNPSPGDQDLKKLEFTLPEEYPEKFQFS